MPSKNPTMETDESTASALSSGLLAVAGDGSAPKPSSSTTADTKALAAPAATAGPGADNEQILVLSKTNGATTMGLAAPPITALPLQLNGQTFHNVTLNLAAFTGVRREEDGLQLAPHEEVASISSYSSVSSPEILSPNPRTPELPNVEFNDTQCSLVRRAEDLNINNYCSNGDSPWIVLRKRESAASDSGDEVNGLVSGQDGGYDLNGAISSSQFIFTDFGSGVPGTFTSSSLTSHTSTSNTTSTTKALPQTVQQAVTATPPAKRLKQPSLNVAHPSKVGPYELKITSQPEEQHRARYLTEGSRGSVKDRGGSSYPTVQLLGYEGPATLQVFVGCDSGKVKPHGFYQACKVYGKSANQFEEREIDGTQVIEIQVEPELDMKVCIDCVGILKLRNADVEARIGPVRSKKRSNRARLVFRVQVPNNDGGIVTLQTASQPILCTQPVGQPEICRMSLNSAPYNGGVDLYLIGKNFLKGSKVIFRETNANEETVWEKEAQIDPEFFHQMHIICTVPSYDHERLVSPRAVCVVVDSAGRGSEGYHFTYTPGPQQKETQTTTSLRTYRVQDVMSMVHCGTALEGKHVIKMETENVTSHQVNMETNTSLPPSTLFPLVQAVQPQTITTPPGVQHNRTINGLDEDSPTGTKPTGMLMDSDPMVSSTMGLTPPNPPAAFPLVGETANELAAWNPATNQTPSKSADVFVDESKSNSEGWRTETTDNKMEVSHETYKTDDQWQNQQWTATNQSASGQWTATNQSASSQWTPAENTTTQWDSQKTESSPVEIPKADSWDGNNQNYGGSAEVTGFENSWNSVIEVPTNTDSQWNGSTPLNEAAKQSDHVTFTPVQCVPEMALAPKEFTTPVQCVPEMALAPKEFTNFNQDSSQLAKFAENESARPLAAENQTGALLLRNQHGRQAVLMTAEDLVKDARTILGNEFIGESGGGATGGNYQSQGGGATGGNYQSQGGGATGGNYQSQGGGATGGNYQSQGGGATGGNYQSQGGGATGGNYQSQESNVFSIPAPASPANYRKSAAPVTNYQNSAAPVTNYQNSAAPVTNYQVPATDYQNSAAPVSNYQDSAAPVTSQYEQTNYITTTCPSSNASTNHYQPTITVNSHPSQTVLMTSQSSAPNTYVILQTEEQGPMSRVQVLTSQQTEVPVHSTATETSQSTYSTVQSEYGGDSVHSVQNVQNYQATVQSTGTTPAPMVMGDAGQGAPMVMGDAGQGAPAGARGRGAARADIKDGLSGGTLPTISLEDVCDILWDEMHT